MGEKTNTLTVDSFVLNLLLRQAKNYMQMKFLTLPFTVAMEADGWTKYSYSHRDLMKEMGISRSSKQMVAFKNYLEVLKRDGTIQVQPDAASHQRYFFSYVSGGLFTTKGGNIPQTGGQIPPADTPIVVDFLPPTGGQIPQKVEQSPPTNSVIGGQIPPASESESVSESKESEKSLTESVLAGIGVGANNFHLANGWDLDELKTLVDGVRQRADIKNKPGYVVKCLESGKQTSGALDEVRRAYEQKIGGVTPVILEGMKAVLTKYPLGWVQDAIGEATNWGAVEQKLKVWHSKGRATPPPQKNADVLGKPQSTELSAELIELAKKAYPTWIYPNGKPTSAN